MVEHRDPLRSPANLEPMPRKIEALRDCVAGQVAHRLTLALGLRCSVARMFEHIYAGDHLGKVTGCRHCNGVNAFGSLIKFYKA